MMLEPKSTVPNEVEPEKGPVQVRKRVFSQRARIGVGIEGAVEIKQIFYTLQTNQTTHTIQKYRVSRY